MTRTMWPEVTIAWTAFVALAGCSQDRPQGSPREGAPIAAARQTLQTDSQVCVTIQRGAAGAVEDAIVWQSSPTWNDGARLTLSTGTSVSGGVRRSLLRFDLGSIPAGATVNSATLSVYQLYKNVAGTIAGHAATAAWAEGTVTSGSFGDGFEPAAFGSFDAPGGGSTGWRALDVRALVQDWVSGDRPNYGVVLIEDGTDNTDFRSSESATAAERPKIDLCYVTCTDGVQNGEETGFDCGGPHCAPCNPDPGPPVGPPVEPAGTSLLVQVVTPDGAPIGGATVAVGGTDRVTDAQGQVLFEGLAAGPTIAQVRAAGFAPGTLTADLEAGVHGGATAALMPMGPPIEFDADSDATITAGAVQLDIPAGALVDEDGLPVTGAAEVAFAAIDPSTDDLDAAPGPLVGTSGNGSEPVDLESGFMAEISLSQGGRPLQVAPGATATIQFALPPSFAETVGVGDLIPAWWLDHAAGVWREDGLGVVEPSPSDPGSLVWTAEVSHFTPWNCDRPWPAPSCLNVLVRDSNGNPLPGRTVTVRGLSAGYVVSRVTGANGRICMPALRIGSARVTVGPLKSPEASTTVIPAVSASCISGGCQPVTLTVNVPCGAPGTMQQCAYTGPSGTAGMGTCKAGYRICNGFTWGACAGQVTPSAEVCENGVDEDCDGQVNDGCPVCADGATRSCYSGPSATLGTGACQAGTQICADGAWGPCSGEVTPAPEVCGNAVDEDCDNLINEGCRCVPEATEACYQGPSGTLGVGQCAGGTRTCYASATGGFWGQCDGQVLPVGEACDGVDNDCDGQADEGGACATCNDGIQNQGELGVDCGGPCAAACSYASCKALHEAQPGLGSGTYTIDPDGPGWSAPYSVYCNMVLDGGGWQLISARATDSGALFANATCTQVDQSCSGTIPPAQRYAGMTPHLLFATLDGVHWLHMAGLSSSGSAGLLDVINLQRLLTTSDSCTGTHYCGPSVDPGLHVHSTSPSFTARFTALTSQYSRSGGVWFGAGGGGAANHVVSLNYAPYCGTGGLDLSSAVNGSLGNVKCGAPGALYFRY
ncbi:MAG: DNRLRE domain-containing protein [Polyangiaceae bacterium]|nr:DNRLRE domain-containing protein [Polyangiaceae bacterium]